VLSHDEVVYGKRSLLSKCQATNGKSFANLRMFLAWMYGIPGKNCSSWAANSANGTNGTTTRALMATPYSARHAACAGWWQHLNYIYKSEPALWQLDDSYEGFDWIRFSRRREQRRFVPEKIPEGDVVAFVVNATPLCVTITGLGVPESGFYREIINTDAETYGAATSEISAGSTAKPASGWAANIQSLSTCRSGDVGV